VSQSGEKGVLDEILARLKAPESVQRIGQVDRRTHRRRKKPTFCRIAAAVARADEMRWNLRQNSNVFWLSTNCADAKVD